MIREELKRYRKLGLPLPREPYDERMNRRALLLGPLELFDRRCAKTGTAIRTTIGPHEPWIVWDREAFEKEFSS